MSAETEKGAPPSAEDVARSALTELVGADGYGEVLRTVEEGDDLVACHVASRQPGYRGWYWAVSVSVTTTPIVNDVVLLPGPEAIVAPGWTPYRDRVQPGDLGPGDVLPPDADDVRLVPSWSAGDHLEPIDRAYAREVGLGREWVLSLEGRELAADRWYAGEQGPDTPLATQAPGSCAGCGFLVSLAGPLADRFGVCANGRANDDGRVVALSHGCGAHSAARLSRSAQPPALPEPAHDTVTPDDLDTL